MSDKVIQGLHGVYKLVNDILIGGSNYAELAERLGMLLKRYREAGMTLASNNVMVGEKVYFAGYIINVIRVYADPKKVEVITNFPNN